jgi:rRNA maturation endonuclease Nob1
MLAPASQRPIPAHAGICWRCWGTGEIIDKDGNVKTCPSCGGSGSKRIPRSGILRQLYEGERAL